MRKMSYNVPLGRISCFPHEVSVYIYIYINWLIELMWRQIIFAKFIEFESCNSALKLVLCRKLKSFFDSYISYEFLDPSVSIQSM